MFAYVTDCWGRDGVRYRRCLRHQFCRSLSQQTTFTVSVRQKRDSKFETRRQQRNLTLKLSSSSNLLLPLTGVMKLSR